MRTTISISDALLHELRQRSRELHCPLNATIEETLRRGLSATAQPETGVKLTTFKVGIKPAYRGLSMNQLYDQIEAEESLRVADE